MSPLERRYRRILALYPRDHRAVHEEEMLGVLLAAAKPGRRRPGAREAADLLRGAISIRIRRFPRALRQDWSDALAIVSVLASVLASLGIGLLAGGFLVLNVIENGGRWNSVYVPLLVAASAWPGVLVLAVAGLRRTSVAAAWVTALLGGVALATQMQEWAVASVAAAVAITLSPGPARGIALLGRARLIAYVSGVAAIGAVLVYGLSDDVGLRPGWATERIAWFAAAVGLVLVLRTSLRFDTATARRTSLLLAMPLTLAVVTLLRDGDLLSAPPRLGEITVGSHSLAYWLQTSVSVAVPAVVFAATLIQVRRARRKGDAAADPEGTPTSG